MIKVVILGMPEMIGRFLMSYDSDALENQLIRDEGLRLTAYKDTEGHLTIGVGHLLGKNEKFRVVSNVGALDLLAVDIGIAERRLTNIFPAWRSLDNERQLAFLNLTFNLGYRLANFKRFLNAAKAEDWDKAADHLKDSKWFRQVKLRGPRVVHAIRTGTPWLGE